MVRRIDISTQSELFFDVGGDRADTPVVIAITELGPPWGGLDEVDGREGFVHIGVPLGIGFILGTPEDGAIGAHFGKEAQGPDVVKLRHFDAAGIFAVVIMNFRGAIQTAAY